MIADFLLSYVVMMAGYKIALVFENGKTYSDNSDDGHVNMKFGEMLYLNECSAPIGC